MVVAIMAGLQYELLGATAGIDHGAAAWDA
jgi:hypothetical protein